MGDNEEVVRNVVWRGSLENMDIYQYHDCRAFLKDWLSSRRVQDASYSLRKFSEAVRLSPAAVSMYLAGHRTLTSKALSKMVREMGLDENQSRYLELIRRIGESDSQDFRLKALKKIQKFRVKHKLSPKSLDGYKYFTKWYYSAIREMAALPNFKLNASWIRKNLRRHVPLAEVREAIKFLKANGYLQQHDTGAMRPPAGHIHGKGGVYRVALSQYHQEMLEAAKESIENTPSVERTILGHALAIPSSFHAKLREILQDSLQKVLALHKEAESAADEYDSVYYVSLATFPLTENKSLSDQKIDSKQENEEGEDA